MMYGGMGPMIHALRKSMGMNQSEFADVLGVRQQTISEWEKWCVPTHTGALQPYHDGCRAE